MLYIPNFLDLQQQKALTRTLQHDLTTLKKEPNGYAVNRYYTELPLTHPAQLFYTPAILHKLEKHLNTRLKPSPHPIEIRLYPPHSYMSYHKDEPYKNHKTYELVYTLYNTSDAKFLWKAPTENYITPKENSVIVVESDGVEHAVSKITKGYRIILKVSYLTKE
jgi:hypothetical protein